MGRILASLLFAGLVACAGAAEDTPAAQRGVAPPTRLPIPNPALNDQPVGKPVSIASVPRAVRYAVRADAARRFKVPEESVVLTRAEQVTWSSAALGCPEPGTIYTQALVPGFRLVAKTGEGELSYHADAGGTVRQCLVHEGPSLPTPAPER
ncbi:MAG TPA: hypothetical protein VFS13_14885 [Steroidobacteraceae bacterium]|jgi:hypothetical protein|nr:hypothetical protein [Steroidobacteraceae bacterium]